MKQYRNVVAFFLMCGAGALLAAAGDTLTTPDGGITADFAFRPSMPPQSLKQVPVWTEIERMLDNANAIGVCPNDPTGNALPGNAQGYGARCSTIQRRRSFLPAGCTYDPSTGLPPCNDALLPRLVVHPLTYNPITGEQMRMLDPAFPGVGAFANRGPVSAGAARLPNGATPVVDFNSPLVNDGGDPGEPAGYSSAAVCGTEALVGYTETRPVCANQTGRLFDPTRTAGGQPRGFVARLRKPSIAQNYLVNSAAALAGRAQALQPSIPSDYVRDPAMAIALGKALFWDMQLGSDGVQACGSCHFNAGTDDRVRNSINPGHLAGDTQLEIFRNRHLDTDEVASDQDVNRALEGIDWPTHRLTNKGQPGEPLINPNNNTRDTNDVIGSMGVRLRRFTDIQVPGTGSFAPAANGVRALLPEVGVTLTDEIPLFRNLRRVEPRNTPTMINSSFYYDNFWDGRASHDFNGGSVFGAADPQSHVYVDSGGALQPTRQLIRFSSVASQIVGPALSDFEMSFRGRNWQKIGKKLLQGNNTAASPDVVPLANQLVAVSDSGMGPWSNQGGSRCVALGRTTAAGRPGLCVSYREMIQQAFFPGLWQNTAQHLNGTARPCTSALNGVVTPAGCDPFDGFVLAIAGGAAAPADRNQFTQMEANFSLFAGLAMQAYTDILVSDDSPFDRFLDRNPQAFVAFTQAISSCNATGNRQPCVTQVEGFNRATPVEPEDDRLRGMDLFFGTNLSTRNPTLQNARCGGCHGGGLMSNNSWMNTNRLMPMDFVREFSTPGTKLARKPMGMPRLATGFLLESLVNGNAVNAIRRDFINPRFGLDANGQSRPQGASFFDTGMYNIGVRPTDEDAMRGGLDPWGWPLSLIALQLKNLGGPTMVPGTRLPTFDPNAEASCSPRCTTGGLFARTAQDQNINPGFSGRIITPRLPSTLAPWMPPFMLGKAHPVVDEVDIGLNTVTTVPIQDGYLDVRGPFNSRARLNQQTNAAQGALAGTFPNVNRVGGMGGSKVPSLRNVELTGPYFRNGGKVTLRQVINFYAHAGDFPVTNGAEKDANIVDLDHEQPIVLSTNERIALTSFLLSLTDERVAREQAPFDRPELFIPNDGRAPDNTGGRARIAAQANAASSCGTAICYRRLAPTGAAGHANRLPSYLNVQRTLTNGVNNDHFDQ
ncbi:Di-heme cytochrome c peroxidase [Lysobacter dokdonensis DS-58]|uniref:Di-heme cytochrome c peroxidase n=1 Tax=Lysobacter dokdonensis DS-58 TaxID=1300345 RepID=A0A0A2WKF5_9GAMM|nr:cytochrome c peroxidase [Lysobacter dokdonensis]KGQ20298.1 Di-heme cytochrome c peroxidase [Lysobacter dokdonensis DS-58]